MTQPAKTNNISTVYGHLLDQLQALRDATPEKLQEELARSRGLSELAQVVTNIAKVEVSYLAATKKDSTPFLSPPDEVGEGSSTTVTPGDRQGITSIVRHRLGN